MLNIVKMHHILYNHLEERKGLIIEWIIIRIITIKNHSNLLKPMGALFLFFLFIWGFTLLSTLYRSYHDG